MLVEAELLGGGLTRLLQDGLSPASKEDRGQSDKVAGR
jgi:hypothetical protein